MAKLYGERWRGTDGKPLGRGGQAEVFRVVDTKGEYPGEWALKRVLNPRRRDRFRNEISAIKRLSHPNIIHLIDHSALDTEDGDEKKQYLVMPIAAGGELSSPERVSLYEGTIDAVLKVSMQIAEALRAAHAVGVVHRDVKPQNVLFTGRGHDLWLTDFGICLISERERATETGEVVGPRAFMAPELEDGGQLEVTPAADIYSLGKVIYYMLSGGVVLPRERLQEDRYAAVFHDGERHRLLQLLLQQMVCPAAVRLTAMEDVCNRLAQIEQWETTARTSLLGAGASRSLLRLNQSLIDVQTARTQEAEVRDREEATRKALAGGFQDWLHEQLSAAASEMSQGPASVSAHPLNLATFSKLPRGRLAGRGLGGAELHLRMPTDGNLTHCLQILLCERLYTRVTRVDPDAAPSPPVARDLEFFIVAHYRRIFAPSRGFSPTTEGFLNRPRKVGGKETVVTTTGSGLQRIHQNVPVERLSETFHSGFSIQAAFCASEWPGKMDEVRVALAEALQGFLDVLNDPWVKVGP